MKFVLILLLLWIGVPGCTSYQEKPNFIFILIDDLGKEWISCYGSSSVSTPNIDRVAGEGILFHNAYSMPQCTPSRVALLTGQYPYTNGWINHYDVPRWGHGASFDASLNPCFPKILQSAGYRTCAAGKWQVNDFRLEPEAMIEAGFDEYCMWTGGEGGNEAISNNRYWDPYIHSKEGSRTYKGAFGPDIFCDFITGFMEENRDHPMFIYYPMVLTHTPFVHTPEEPDANSRFEKHRAMVRYTDLIIGKIVSSLRRLKIKDDTYLFITTDNGTTRSMIGERNGEFIRGGKAFLTENGINAPFIVLVPGSRQGSESDALVDFTDIYPTLLDLAGIDLPQDDRIEGSSFSSILRGDELKGSRDWILSMGGHPAMIGPDGRVKSYFAFRDRVMRDGRYKVYIDTLKRIHRIYDLEEDPYETNNLIANKKKIQPVMEKFLSVLNALPQQDNHPAYKKLNESFYNISVAELNRTSRNVHLRYNNMIPLATREEYLQLTE
ncbi:MAG: sulfatase-like hydrolase/transferase [Bacteroidales bacterium]|nr:sulfatase-like hydrolase/transferase [Bacteroidales bacterium]